MGRNVGGALSRETPRARLDRMRRDAFDQARQIALGLAALARDTARKVAQAVIEGAKSAGGATPVKEEKTEKAPPTGGTAQG